MGLGQGFLRAQGLPAPAVSLSPLPMRSRVNTWEARPNRHSVGASRARPRDEDSLPELLAAGPDPLVLVLDGVQDPQNLGAILRTCDGAGVRAVISTKHGSAPLNDTARTISCGGADGVPYVLVTNLARTLEFLQESGLRILGTADQSATDLYATDLRGPVALVLGAEGDGMRRLTSEKCDGLIRIPMLGKVPCLNVSVSAGVCLYEAVRQRRAKA